MKILVTGAAGFVGKNLCAALKNIADGKDRTRPELKIDEIYEYDIDSTAEQLDEKSRWLLIVRCAFRRILLPDPALKPLFALK